MAYVLKRNLLKNGDTTLYISSVSRVPGTKNKHRETILEKYSAKELRGNGEDPDAFMLRRIGELRAKAKEGRELQSTSYMVDFSIPLTLTAHGDLKENDDASNIGYAAYSRIYHRLELDELINNRRRYLKADYNANVIFQHLVYSHLLWPASKKDTWEHVGRFYGDNDYPQEHMYRTMDNILSWRTDILTQLDAKIKEKYGRKETIVFYDVTNCYFERDEEDGANEPIIQMGLFMDELGLPITYELFRGNTNDSETFRDAMDKCIIDFSGKRKIIVANKSMMCYRNILKIRNDRNGYVIKLPISKMDDETKAFALSPDGWRMHVDSERREIVSKIKERTVKRMASSYGVVDNVKHSGIYNERQVFIWTQGTKEMDGLKFDEEKLKEDEKYDGYSILCSNVVGTERPDPDKDGKFSFYRDSDELFVLNHDVRAEEVIDIYENLCKIEEYFKVTKTEMLNLLPHFHSMEDRIRAHYFISFVSLVIERLLEFSMGWAYSAEAIQQSLSHFNVTNLPKSNFYLVNYYDQVVENVLIALGIHVPKKFLSQADLRTLFAETKKKDYES